MNDDGRDHTGSRQRRVPPTINEPSCIVWRVIYCEYAIIQIKKSRNPTDNSLYMLMLPVSVPIPVIIRTRRVSVAHKHCESIIIVCALLKL
jgi:hypothetical protein